MNISNHFITQLTRHERRVRLFNKVVDIFHHILVMIAFILFFSFLQMIISK